MNTVLIIITLISSVTTCVVSCFHAWLAIKRERSKDEIWETATRLMSGRDIGNSADDFATVYAELRFVKQHPDAVLNYPTIRHAMSAQDKPELAE